LTGSQCPGSGCPWTNSAAAQTHLDTVAGIIREMNVDVLNLAEVQNCDVLSSLNAKLSGMGYNYYLVKGTDSATGQNVALLTRVDPEVDLKRTEARVSYPLSGSNCGSPTKGDTGISKHYYTYLTVNGLKITLLGLHLIAIPDDPVRCNQREGQISVAVQVVNQEIKSPSSEGIVLGDLNDYDGTYLDDAKSVPISRCLAMLKDAGLTNVARLVSTRYTGWWDKNDNCKVDLPQEGTGIDHILVSKGLNSRLLSAEHVHTFTPQCPPANYDPDHWPVVATFDMSGLSGAQGALGSFEGGSPSAPALATWQLAVIIVSSVVGAGIVVAAAIIVYRKMKKPTAAEGTPILSEQGR